MELFWFWQVCDRTQAQLHFITGAPDQLIWEWYSVLLFGKFPCFAARSSLSSPAVHLLNCFRVDNPMISRDQSPPCRLSQTTASVPFPRTSWSWVSTPKRRKTHFKKKRFSTKCNDLSLSMSTPSMLDAEDGDKSEMKGKKNLPCLRVFLGFALH